MVAALLTELRLPIPPIRLAGYRPPGGSDEDMLATYLWNMELASALSPALAALEVALRNGLHETLVAHLMTPYWFDTPGLFPPNPRRLHQPHPQRRAIDNARRALNTLGKPATADRIVAELTFGFWTTMLTRAYHPIWNARNAAALKAAFPYAQGAALQRYRLHDRYDALRLMRNRIVHHEPIWNRPTLVQDYADVLEATGWISPSLRELVERSDRFRALYHAGPVQSRAVIRACLAGRTP